MSLNAEITREAIKTLTCNFSCYISEIPNKIPSKHSTITKLFLNILDKLPFIHSHHLKDFERNIQRLNDKMWEISDLFARIILLKMDNSTLKQQYLNALSKFEDTPFSKTKKMSKTLQNYLNPELARLRKEKSENSTLAIDMDHKLKRKIEKAKLATEHGFGVIENKGGQGTLIITDINTKPVGIHKVSDENLSKFSRLKNLFKYYFGQLSLLSPKSNALPEAEKMAYLMSKTFNFDLVPPSCDVDLGRKGVMQLFISKEKGSFLTKAKRAVAKIVKTKKTEIQKSDPLKYVEACAVLKQLKRPYQEFNEDERSLFQKFVLFDYLIGNLDRHEENWFVIFSLDTDRISRLTHIKAIDNANAFPKKHSKELTSGWITSFLNPTRNQYKWKQLPLSKAPFTEAVKSYVKTHLSKDVVEKNMQSLQQKIPGFFDQEMLSLLHERVENLHKMLGSPNGCPKCLAEC